jgi:hypothetical protein
VRSERVTFEEGQASRSVVDAIAGFERVHYVVSAHEGQTLTVNLASSNLSNTFDISAPAAPKPFFVGGDAGNTHSFRVPASGDYIIDVHLLRFAARDYQSAQYTLNVALAD